MFSQRQSLIVQNVPGCCRVPSVLPTLSPLITLTALLTSGEPSWAAANVELGLARNGLLTWTTSLSNGVLVLETNTAAVVAGWLPMRALRTSNQAGTVSLGISNQALFVKAAGGERSMDDQDMALVPGGFFRMGDTYNEGWADELPMHDVYVSPFWIDKYEVTNEEMREVIQYGLDGGRVTTDGRLIKHASGNKEVLLGLKLTTLGPSDVRWFNQIILLNGRLAVEEGKETYPCIAVSWYGAAAFCNFLSEIRGYKPCYNLTNWTCDFNANGFRLPTEAEWEKAARGGFTGHHYPWESFGGSFLKHIDPSKTVYTEVGQPHPFNTKPVGYYNGSQAPPGVDMANGFGLFDMASNVREWCWDWYRADWYSQPGATEPDPIGPPTGTDKVTRGGSFDLHSKSLRCATRNYQLPVWATSASWYNGLRCVRRP